MYTIFTRRIQNSSMLLKHACIKSYGFIKVPDLKRFKNKIVHGFMEFNAIEKEREIITYIPYVGKLPVETLTSTPVTSYKLFLLLYLIQERNEKRLSKERKRHSSRIVGGIKKGNTQNSN